MALFSIFKSLALSLLIKKAKSPYCEMLGVIYPFDQGIEKDIKLFTTETKCFNKMKMQRSGLAINSCCNKELTDRVVECWKTKKDKVQARIKEIKDLTQMLFEKKSVDSILTYLKGSAQPKGRILQRMQNEKMEELDKVNNLNYYLNVVYESNPTARRRFLAEVPPKTRIEQAQQEMTISLQENQFKSTLNQMYTKEAEKCWNYYMNTVQRGVMCSFCLDDSSNQYFNIDNGSGRKITFDFASCDKFVPHCLKMTIIQTRISRFFQNVFILIINKIYKGGSILDNNIRTFMRSYEEGDSSKIVESCEKNANCDALCNSTIKFGDFSNEYIMGDVFLLNRSVLLSAKTQEIIAGNTGETLTNFIQTTINSVWVEDELLKQITLKDWKHDLVTDPTTRKSTFQEYKTKKQATGKFKVSLLEKYNEIKVDHLCFKLPDTATGVNVVNEKRYDTFSTDKTMLENVRNCVFQPPSKIFNGKERLL